MRLQKLTGGCTCDRLRLKGQVKVIGWNPNARVVYIGLHHRIVVRFETLTGHERDFDCDELEPICPLEELAKL